MAIFSPESENSMFGAHLDALGSFRTQHNIPPKNEVEVQPAKKLINFGGFLAFFQPKSWSFAILAPFYDQKNYGQNLGQMSKNDQSTLCKA